MEKATLGFCIYKIWQILKRFAGTFHPAQTLKFGGVTLQVYGLATKWFSQSMNVIEVLVAYLFTDGEAIKLKTENEVQQLGSGSSGL